MQLWNLRRLSSIEMPGLHTPYGEFLGYTLCCNPFRTQPRYEVEARLVTWTRWPSIPKKRIFSKFSSFCKKNASLKPKRIPLVTEYPIYLFTHTDRMVPIIRLNVLAMQKKFSNICARIMCSLRKFQ